MLTTPSPFTSPQTTAARIKLGAARLTSAAPQNAKPARVLGEHSVRVTTAPERAPRARSIDTNARDLPTVSGGASTEKGWHPVSLSQLSADRQAAHVRGSPWRRAMPADGSRRAGRLTLAEPGVGRAVCVRRQVSDTAARSIVVLLDSVRGPRKTHISVATRLQVVRQHEVQMRRATRRSGDSDMRDFVVHSGGCETMSDRWWSDADARQGIYESEGRVFESPWAH